MPGAPGTLRIHRPAHSHLVPAELATVVRRFSQTGIQDFLTLTLTEQTGLLYVGAREALFAFGVEALELQGAVRGGGAGGTQAWGEWQDPEGLCLSKLSPQPYCPHPVLPCGNLAVSRPALRRRAERACCFPASAALGQFGASVPR